MKKSILLFVFIFASITITFAQNPQVPNTQKPLIVKIAASWCPPCGGWGWDFFDNIYDDNSENAIFLSVHHSGDHTNAVASDMTQNFSVFGQPRFILDGVDQNVNSSNAGNKQSDIYSQVGNVLEQDPKIQTGIEASFAANTLSVDYAVELFENLTGDYYMGLYLVEKIHVGYQASIGQNAEHKTLLRNELSGNTFGTMVVSGSGSSGDKINGNFEMDLGDYVPENLQIVSIIWKKEGNNYIVVNSNIDDNVEEQITSSAMDVGNEKPEFKVFPTTPKEEIKIRLALSKDIINAQIIFMDVFGRQITRLFEGDVMKGSHEFDIYDIDRFAKGMYLVSFESKDFRVTRRVIIE